jgi:hypothetical protein
MKDNDKRFWILICTLLLLMILGMSSCSTSKQAYTPSKVTSKKLLVCNNIGCYKKQ